MATLTTAGIRLAPAILVAGFSTYAADVQLGIYVNYLHDNGHSNFHGDRWQTTVARVDDESFPDEKVIGISDIVTRVKETLGLPNKDIAEIFQVTRQTLHSYKNADQQHVVNAAVHERAQQLWVLMADLADVFEQSPGAMAKNYTFEGHTLLQLLGEEVLNKDTILVMANKLAEKASLGRGRTINHSTLSDLTATT